MALARRSSLQAHAAATAEFRIAARPSEVGDFLKLTKPRILLLTTFTALCGMVLADGNNHIVLNIIALLAVAMGAGGAAAFNMWYDRDIDRLMLRTRTRPVACGTIAPSDAFVFAMTLSLFAFALLGLAGGWAAAALLASTILFYSVFYTMFLKRRTVYNTVIGGAAGAAPPFIGWLAANPSPQANFLEPLLLCALIFLWTPPHSWALALLRRDDYKRAGVPVLPVVCGEKKTKQKIFLYSLTLLPLAIAFAWIGGTSWIYGGIAFVLSSRFIFYALWMNRKKETSLRAAGALFGFSIVYMILMFSLRIVDHVAEQQNWQWLAI